MIYSLEQIINCVKPIAEKYKLPAVYLFGSYARGDATEDSDIDFLIDRAGSDIKNLLNFADFCAALEDVFLKGIDVLTVQQLEQEGAFDRMPYMIEAISRERVSVYGN